MEWKRKQEFKNIVEVIEYNTGLTIDELMKPKRFPYIKNLDEAVALTKECIQKGMKITIIGDYDCDGDTSSSILQLGLWEYTGIKPVVRLPRRFSEGYGLSMKMVDEIDEGLIITVDNGIAAVEPIKAAKEKGLTVIILDHHVIRDDGLLPEADVIVDPHAIEGSEYNEYCGAGLAYRFIMALNPDTKLQKELVALAGVGTVADVMKLVGDNRNLVTESLEAMANRNVTFGTKMLLDAIGFENYITESDYGFKIGPCFNASGRLKDNGAEKVVDLITMNPSFEEQFFLEPEARAKAQELVALNEERKKLVFDTMIEVYADLEGKEKIAPLVYYREGLHEGIVGIIAGRLAEDYHMPALVFTDSKEEGIVKGSGRSYGGINLKEMLDATSEVFTKYGGHAGAAGMSLPKENLDTLQRNLTKLLSNVEMEAPDTLYYDLVISEEEVPVYAEELRKYAPYGEGCPTIKFLIKDFNATPKGSGHYDIMGDFKNHVKIFGENISVLGFDMVNRYRDDGFPMHMDIIGQLSILHMMGKTIYTVEILDYKKHDVKKTEVFNNLSSLLNFC